LNDFEETPKEDAPAAPRPEPRANLHELLAMKKIPDIHAAALALYAGDVRERPISEWMDLYSEFMSKPTGLSREQWHPLFISKRGK
jgi:hypothetical protein